MILQTDFPEIIKEAKTLVHIDASFNNLTVIGDKLDELPLLKTLNLCHNSNLDEKSMSEKCLRLHGMV